MVILQCFIKTNTDVEESTWLIWYKPDLY